MANTPPLTGAPVSAEEVTAVLRNAKTFARYRQLLIDAGIEDPNEAALALFVLRLARGASLAEEFLESIRNEYGATDELARKIAVATAEVLKPFEQSLSFSLQEYTQTWSQQANSPKPPTVPSRQPSSVANDSLALDQELERIKRTTASVLEHKGPLDVPGIVREICANRAFAFEDSALMARCQKLIESRVRDVRTAQQTRAALERPIEQGGLGVSVRRLADILQALESRVATYQGRVADASANERAQKVSSSPNPDALAKNEETLMTKRYVELTGKVPDEHITPTAPNVSRTSVAISAHHEQLAREGKIDSAKVKASVVGARQVVAPGPKTAPSMQEVTFTKRLSGPVDELRSLTLTDFRRLSKDPFQAATKVKDKADAQEEQGYEKKVEAIQAWRLSPLNQMYVGMTREAVLTGVSVVEILEKKRKAGEDTFTDQELKAVMRVNAELRF